MPQDSSRPRWQGQTRDVPEVRHRWEQEWTSIQNKEFVEPPRKSQRRLFFMLVGTLALVGGFIYLLAFSPQRTPLAAICLQNYQWPLPPNRGVAEDLAGLAELDLQNLEVDDLSNQWQAVNSGLDTLSKYLDATLAAAHSRPVCLLYVSGYGAVNNSGEPCLVLPGYSPSEEHNWLPVREVIQRINARPSTDTKILLILDCVKERDNWSMGIANSTWSTRLRQLYGVTAHPNLVIFSSVGDAQQSAASPLLNGTVFGTFVKLGLAGAADQSPGPGNRSSGNHDGQVKLSEFCRYVQENVSQWVLANRGEVQLPELLGSPEQDFHLSWSLQDSTLAQMKSDLQSTAAPPISIREITALWSKFEKLKSMNPLQFSPAVFSDFEHRLLWLEELAAAGGVGRRATSMANTLDEELAAMLARLEASSSSFVSRSRSFQRNPEPANLMLDLGSIELNEFFGTINETEAVKLREQFRSASPGTADDSGSISIAIETLPLQDKVLASRLREVGQLNIWPTSTPINRWVEIYLAAESAALPADIRIHPLIRPLLETADGQRRQAFDQLYAGNAERFAAAGANAENALDGLLGDSGGQVQRLSQAYADRDRALAELPYLARWQLRWRLPGGDTNIAQRQNELGDRRKQLSGLVAQLRRYAQALGTAADVDVDLLQPSHPTNPITQWQKLRAEFDQLAESLVARNETDIQVFRELVEMLKTPLLSAEMRRLMLEKKTQIESDLAKDYSSSTSSADTSESTLSGSNEAKLTAAEALAELVNESELQSATDDHPLFSLVPNWHYDSPPPGSEPKLAMLIRLEQGAHLARIAFQAIADGEEPGGDGPAADGAVPDRVGQRRARLQEASHLFRQSAGLFPAFPAIDPVRELERFELQQFLVWQSQRSLDDFFGYPEGELSAELQKAPAFRLLTEKYLQRLSQPDLSPGVDPGQLANLNALLEDRSRLAARGFRLQVDTGAALQTGFATELDIALVPGSDDTTQQPPLAPGDMVFRLAADRKLVTSPSSHSIFPPDVDQVIPPLQVPADIYGTYDQVNAFFRGNEYRARVISTGLSGYVVDWQVNPDVSSEATLFGDRKGRPSILFALDCSQSMGNEIQAESIGDQQSPRLTFAKGALASMLAELAARGDSRVGVRFFGHRIGWSTDSPTTALPQESYTGEIPDGLLPENDVELVLPLGRFTESEGQAVLKKMNSIQPWGQSPLYLTLLEAIRDFESEPQDVERSIVVITDGLNYQFSPAGNSLSSVRKTGLEDLVAELERNPIPIYILGFGIAADEEAIAAEEFLSIANLSHGGYFPVKNGKELLDVLENQLNLGQYEITGTNQGDALQPAAEESNTLGNRILLPHPGDYQILFDDVQLPFAVDGGEALKFYLRDQAGAIGIGSLPYTDNSMVAATMLTPQDSRTLTARLQRPEVSSEGVNFSLSFQFESQAFTPRPQEVWVEFHPLQDEPGDPEPVSYIFYDRRFESSTPVPVMRFKANGWPSSIQSASCVIHCKFSETPPTHSIPITQWLNNRDLINATQTLPGVDGFQFQVEISESATGGGTVQIMEQHASPSAGLFSLKVNLAGSPGALPFRTVREFDTRNQMASHVFHFDETAFRAFRQSDQSRITFTARADLLQDAWSLGDGPVDFRIGNGQGVLPLDAAEGDR